MLISPNLMFVHHPRTGGTSVRNHLMKLMPYNYLPINDPNLSNEQKTWFLHQGLTVCHQYATQLRLNPNVIPTLVVIRNPYSLMLSEYMYLTQKWKKKIKDLEKTFLLYLANQYKKTSKERKDKWAADTYGRFQDFICVNGQTPDNLTIGRYENLTEDVNLFITEKLGLSDDSKLPHKNASRHGEFKNYFTEKEEKLVYALWKNAFDSGLYKRYEGLE